MTAAPEQVTALAASLLGQVDEMTQDLVAVILEQDPSYDSTRTSRADLTQSCHDNLSRILHTLAGTGPLDAFDAPEATGRRRAEQGVPLESVLHAYRLGHRVIWDALVARAREGGTLEALVEAAGWVWERVDAYSSAVAAAYRTVEASRVHDDEQRRQSLVDALLDGRGHDRVVAAAAAEGLQLPEHGPYVALVVSGGLDREPVAGALGVRGVRTAWRRRGERELGLLALGPVEVHELLVLLRAVAPDLRAGISPLTDGLATVDDAARLAETALRALPTGQLGVARLDDRLPAALLVSAPELGARLVQRALGPVLLLDPPERDLLLETLRGWLDCGGSASRTAALLFCHRNTVLNRVRRLEALTGRSAERVDDLLEWSLALTAREVTG